MTQVRVRVCSVAELDVENVIAVPIPVGPDKRPREALVLRGADGRPRAYVNRCRHLPIPIDAGSKSYLTQDKQHLLCGTHGALYRRDDGMCVAGPCLHLALEALPVLEEGGDLHVLV
jgi:nitrite reductase/ring-hydroxylating ferredoxin subunit